MTGERIFLIWSPGESKVLRFVFDPFNYSIPLGEHYIPKENRYVYCLSTDPIIYDEISWRDGECPICHALGSGPAIRIYVPVIDLTDANKIKILRQGRTFWARIFERQEELLEAGDSILNYAWKITREGEGRDNTTYKIIRDAKPTPLPNPINFPPGVNQENLWSWFESIVNSRKKTYAELAEIAKKMRFGADSVGPETPSHTPFFTSFPHPTPTPVDVFGASESAFPPEPTFSGVESVREEAKEPMKESNFSPPNLLALIQGDEETGLKW